MNQPVYWKVRTDFFFVAHVSCGSNIGCSPDGRNQANQLRLVVYPIIYKVLAPSQMVVSDF